MPFESLRFMHTTGLYLDGPLQGTGPLDGSLREIAEEATLIAYQRVIAASIEHKVDFILLAGNSFDASHKSLRAQVALRRSFEQLAEHDIRVFVAPGTIDPADAWRELPALPENVTTLLDLPGEPVAVLRNGKVIASVNLECQQQLPRLPRSENNQTSPAAAYREPFTIGLCVSSSKRRNTLSDEIGHESIQPSGNESTSAVEAGHQIQHPLANCALDYLALGGAGGRRSVSMRTGIAHHPGSPQGLGPKDMGPHGCTFVEVDSDGAVHHSFISTAPVRYEQSDVEIGEQTGRAELRGLLRDRLEQNPPEPGEQLRLIEWTVRARGPLAELFENPADRAALMESAELSSLGQQVSLAHTFRVFPQRAPDPTLQEQPLWSDFLQTLQRTEFDAARTARHVLGEGGLKNSPWKARLEELLGELDYETIESRVNQLGAEALTLEQSGS